MWLFKVWIVNFVLLFIGVFNILVLSLFSYFFYYVIVEFDLVMFVICLFLLPYILIGGAMIMDFIKKSLRKVNRIKEGV